MSDQPFSLDVLYKTIEQHLQQSLTGIQLVSFWPDIEQTIPLPAVFLDIAEIEPGTPALHAGRWLHHELSYHPGAQ